MGVTVIPPHELEVLSKEHADEILELDCKSCLYFDEDIGLDIVHPHAWDRQGLLSFIKQRVPPTFGYVLKLPESANPHKVFGYMAFELLPEQYHLLSIVVDPDMRRLGLGLAMMMKLHNKVLSHQERKTISIHVREHDDASIGFFKTLKFKSRLLRSYFEDREDAIHFWFTEKKTVRHEEEE